MELRVAAVALVFSFVALVTSALTIWLTVRRDRVQRGQYSLAAYRLGIDALLQLKGGFMEHPGCFPSEVLDPGLIASEEANSTSPNELDPKPAGTTSGQRVVFHDTKEFLLYASGMWNLSFAWRVSDQASELCISPDDRRALEGEIDLWLGLPKFQLLLEKHSKINNAHSQEFLSWIDGRDDRVANRL